MSSVFRLSRHPVRSGTGHGGGSLWRAAGKWAVGRRWWLEWWKESRQRAEEKDWWTVVCRSRVELTGGRASSWPSRLTVRHLRDSVWMLLVYYSGQFRYSIKLYSGAAQARNRRTHLLEALQTSTREVMKPAGSPIQAQNWINL